MKHRLIVHLINEYRLIIAHKSVHQCACYQNCIYINLQFFNRDVFFFSLNPSVYTPTKKKNNDKQSEKGNITKSLNLCNKLTLYDQHLWIFTSNWFDMVDNYFQ